MSLPDRLGTAFARLSGALDHLESAVARRAEADAGRADLDLEFSLLQDDRSRLATELDAALARARGLLTANAQVSARLDRATSEVEAVLAQIEPVARDPRAAPGTTARAWPDSIRAGE